MAVTDRRRAYSLIRRNCLSTRMAGDEHTWWDTAIAPNDIEADLVAEGVAYLESRGLVVRHAHRRSWIQVLTGRRASKSATSFPSRLEEGVATIRR